MASTLSASSVDQLTNDMASSSLNGGEIKMPPINTNVGTDALSDDIDTAGPTPSSAAPHPQASASLYVGELDQSVTEAMLFELFSTIGSVASIRVCRDAVTRRSLGYAYVNYNSNSDGEKALEELNYTLIKGRPCRIMWSQRDPALRKTGHGNVFIKNLDILIDNKALHDTFAAFGNILSCKVAQDEDGNSKGYGFVHYEVDEAAHQAIKHVNGMLLNEKKVFVGHHVPKKDRLSKFDEMKANFTNVYVKNISPDGTEDELRALFASYGEVTSTSLAKDADGKSRGFGFVNFLNHEDANRAVDELSGRDWKGQELYLGRAQKKHEREEELRKSYEAARVEKAGKFVGINLYVKNLEDDIDDDKLRQIFSEFGPITSAKVMRDVPPEFEDAFESKENQKDGVEPESENNPPSDARKSGKSKGFGFVCFVNSEDATKALAELNTRMINGKPLYVALAQRKDVRKSQLESNIQARANIRQQQLMAAAAMGQQFIQQPVFYPTQPGFMPPVGGRAMPFPQPNMPVQGGQGGRPAQFQAYGPQQGRGMPQQMAQNVYGMPGPYPPGAYGQPTNQQFMAAIQQAQAQQAAALVGERAVSQGRGPMQAMPGLTGSMPGLPIPVAGAIPGFPPGARQPSGMNSMNRAGNVNNAGNTTRNGQMTNFPMPIRQPDVGLLHAQLTASSGNSAHQKQLLGEVIFPKVQIVNPELAGKITGMLLEMDNSELVSLIEDDNMLKLKVSEAMVVYDEYLKAHHGFDDGDKSKKDDQRDV